jgi:hypothetical protein
MKTEVHYAVVVCCWTASAKQEEQGAEMQQDNHEVEEREDNEMINETPNSL